MAVVLAAHHIEEVYRCNVAFAALHCCDAANAANRDDARRKALIDKTTDHDVEPNAVASHDDDIRGLGSRTDQRHLFSDAGIKARTERVDGHKTIGPRKRRNSTRALADWECNG